MQFRYLESTQMMQEMTVANGSENSGTYRSNTTDVSEDLVITVNEAYRGNVADEPRMNENLFSIYFVIVCRFLAGVAIMIYVPLKVTFEPFVFLTLGNGLFMWTFGTLILVTLSLMVAGRKHIVASISIALLELFIYCGFAVVTAILFTMYHEHLRDDPVFYAVHSFVVVMNMGIEASLFVKSFAR